VRLVRDAPTTARRTPPRLRTVRLRSIEMAEIALEALANARRLYDDASLLHDHGRIPSAFMTFGLAADELGKHQLVAAFSWREQTDAEWRKFRRRFRSHTEKLGNALLGAWMGDLLSDDPPPEPVSFHKRRLSATYVDFSETGRVSTPLRSVSDIDVRNAREGIGRELAYCEGVMKGAIPASLAEAMDRMANRSSTGTEELRALHEVSPKAVQLISMADRVGLPREEALRTAWMLAEILASHASGGAPGRSSTTKTPAGPATR
jgi:AbiV family abortive infection protein